MAAGKFATRGAEQHEPMVGAARGIVEAALLGVVAFGCAQVGWSVVSPPTADATGSVSTSRTVAEQRASAEEVLSPFAADATASDVGGHAAAAVLSSLQVVGVRVGADGAPSSAIVVAPDGGQKVLRLGDDIGDGLRLADVASGYIVVASPGGQLKLDMAPTPISYARALMGKANEPIVAPQTSAEAKTGSAETSQMAASAPLRSMPTAVQASQPLGATAPQSGAPLNATMALQGDRAGAVKAWLSRMIAARLSAPPSSSQGWTIPTEAPPEAASLGLQAGDEIQLVNGVDATQTAAILASLSAGAPITVTLRRMDNTLTVVLPGFDAPMAENKPT